MNVSYVLFTVSNVFYYVLLTLFNNELNVCVIGLSVNGFNNVLNIFFFEPIYGNKFKNDIYNLLNLLLYITKLLDNKNMMFHNIIIDSDYKIK